MNSFNYFPRRLFHGLFLGFVLASMSLLSAAAQKNLPKAEAAADAAQQKVKSAIQKGTPLTHVSSTDVTSNISVEATLIPAGIARTVFGKEIANNYAVIALTVSNRSADQAFIVHSIFIDYSQWLLSGGSPFLEGNTLCPQGKQNVAGNVGQTVNSTTTSPSPSGTADLSQKPSGETTDESGSAPQPQTADHTTPQNCPGNRLQTWQQQTRPNQVASIESRIVREELLIEQYWTTRNWVLRALQAAGSVATGFTFATSSQSWIHGIGAFNGSVIPAYQQFWPDSTVSQMNQISNVGFQTNKAIAKQSSDIIVAFFPIDRFLTPDLKSLYISTPAAFFSPVEALVDPKTRKRVEPYVVQILGGKDNKDALFGNMLKFLPQLGSSACERYQNSRTPLDGSVPAITDKSASTVESRLELACLTAEVVNRLSLNTVRLIVGGTMTVDVNSVPPQIASVEIAPPTGETTSTMWTIKAGAKSVTLNGTINGSFLGGATPTLVNPPNGLTIKAVAQGSSDTALQFTLTLTASLPASTKSLSFQASKSSSAGSTIKSATYDYQIEQIQEAPAPEGGKGEGSNTVSNPPPASPEKPVAPPKK